MNTASSSSSGFPRWRKRFFHGIFLFISSGLFLSCLLYDAPVAEFSKNYCAATRYSWHARLRSVPDVKVTTKILRCREESFKSPVPRQQPHPLSDIIHVRLFPLGPSLLSLRCQFLLFSPLLLSPLIIFIFYRYAALLFRIFLPGHLFSLI